jgi:hypothetical protein
VSALTMLITLEAWLFLGAIALLLLYRFASAQIDLSGAQFYRLQLLLSALGFAAYYLSLVTSDTAAGSLPDPGSVTVTGFGASGLFYLLNKLIGSRLQIDNRIHTD